MSVRRIAAAAALLLVVAVIAFTIVALADDVPRLLVQLVLLAIALLAGWVAVTREGWKRAVGAVLAVAAVVGIVLLQAGGDDFDGLSLILRIVALIVAIGLARYAIGTTDQALRAADTPGTPVAPAERGVLFMNLKSGGGKAERFHLVDECRARGIEPVVLEGGQDWVAIIRGTAPKHDVVGMAGGDGSQALVGSIAAELGLPMVVVPAGTRNHLALDLGLDRDDVVGALDAYGDAVERPMDLGDVNGKVFVNNVSLGLYAAIVRSPEYRDAKADTTLAALPKVLGPGTEPFDLRFDAPDGHHDGAHLIQVSNNPYGDTLAALGSRPRLDTKRIGVVSLIVDGDRGINEVPRRRRERSTRPLRGAHIVVGADLRGLIGITDRGRARRRDRGDGLPAPVLHPSGSGAGPTAPVRDRILTCRSLAGLGGNDEGGLGRPPRSSRPWMTTREFHVSRRRWREALPEPLESGVQIAQTLSEEFGLDPARFDLGLKRSPEVPERTLHVPDLYRRFTHRRFGSERIERTRHVVEVR